MGLKEKEKEIEHYVKTTKNNFLKIGCLLKEIRDNRLYLEEGFETWTDYMHSGRFEFSYRHAYKLIDVYEKFGKVPLMAQLGLGKLLELAYVTDKEVREDLASNAIKEGLSKTEIKEEVQKITQDRLISRITRRAQREDPDLEVKEDSAKDKCKRLAQNILTDLQALQKPMKEMKLRVENWLTFSKKFEDEELEGFKGAIYTKLKELKEI